jgi:putative two-component system response regulator
MIRLRNATRLPCRTRHPLIQLRAYLLHADQELRRTGNDTWHQRVALLASRADPDAGHAPRVAELAERLATATGSSEDAARMVRRAADLHDIGKFALPHSLLHKAGPLDAEQRELLVLHTYAACWLLAELEHPVFQLARIVGRGHHERWDGRGYPDRTNGAETPLAARIVAVCDVWDALTHARPYRPAFSYEQAAAIVRDMAGTALDPVLAASLLDIVS